MRNALDWAAAAFAGFDSAFAFFAAGRNCAFDGCAVFPVAAAFCIGIGDTCRTVFGEMCALLASFLAPAIIARCGRDIFGHAVYGILTAGQAGIIYTNGFVLVWIGMHASIACFGLAVAVFACRCDRMPNRFITVIFFVTAFGHVVLDAGFIGDAIHTAFFYVITGLAFAG